jgi:hypothetical protein
MVKVIRVDGSQKLIHCLAGSRRQEGFPIFIADEIGKIVWEGKTSKRTESVDLSGSEAYLVHLYESNSRLRYVYIYNIRGEVDGAAPEEFREDQLGLVMNRLPGEAGQRAVRWLIRA